MILFSLGLVMSAAVLLSKMREAALFEAQAQAERFAADVQVALNRSLASIDALLGGLADPQAFKRDDPGLSTRLEAARQQNPSVRRLALLDEQGRVIGVAPAHAVTNGQQPGFPAEFLGELGHAGASHLVVGVAQTLDASLRVLHLGRGFERADGRRVLAVAEVALRPRIQALVPGADIPGLETTLERTSLGKVLVSEPVPAAVAVHPSAPAGPDPEALHWEQPARVSGSPALVVWRALDYPDLRLGVSVRREDVLHRWRFERNVVAGAVAVFVAAALALAASALRYLHRLLTTRHALERTRALEHQALEAMDCGFLSLDAQRRVVQWNGRFVELFPMLAGHVVPGTPLLELLQVGLRATFPELPDDSFEAIWRRRFEQQGTYERELILRDGRCVQVRERPTPDGGRVITYHDVSDLRRAALAVEQLVLSDALAYRPEQRLKLFEAMNCGVLLLDEQRRVTQWNARFVEFFPSLQACLAPRVGVADLFHAWLKDCFPGLSEAGIAALLETRFGPRGEEARALELANGRRLRVRAQPMPDGSWIMTYHDVDDMRHTTDTIERLVFNDPLTNLPNRRLLMDRLHQAQLAHRERARWGALLFLDIDHFAAINDALGPEAGDRVLKDVAAMLAALARPIDTVARLNGDEFVLMMPELAADREEALVLARRAAEGALSVLAQRTAAGEPQRRRTASIGVVLIGGQDMPPPTGTITHAAIAMEQAKSRGRNNVCFFDPAMQRVIAQRASLEVGLQRALELGEFVLHYQPQCWSNGRVVGVEALLRWRHPQRGILLPAEFVPVAEDSELIVPIGLWCLEEAAAQLADWRRKPGWEHLSMSVNVSAGQLRGAHFPEQVGAILAATDAPAGALKLELTESGILENVDDSVAKLERLRATGVRISLDDFGTGQSSLSYLARLPLDQLKIDQSFVRRLGGSYADDAVVQAIIALARTLHLEVVAEGVESVEQCRRLQEAGCHLSQGWLHGQPMPIAELQRWMRTRPARAH